MRYVLVLLSIIGIASCRGWTSDLPPVHPNPNMDTQPKYKPYRESQWFADKRDMRPLVEGVVARGQLKDDDHFFRGKIDGRLATEFPTEVKVNRGLLDRGREQFNIHCTPCHRQTGTGEGTVAQRLTIKPPTFHSDYMRNQPLGHFFDVISNGVRTMPAYGHIPEADRWAIVSYIRALQLSQDAEGKWLMAWSGK